MRTNIGVIFCYYMDGLVLHDITTFPTKFYVVAKIHIDIGRVWGVHIVSSQRYEVLKISRRTLNRHRTAPTIVDCPHANCLRNRIYRQLHWNSLAIPSSYCLIFKSYVFSSLSIFTSLILELSSAETLLIGVFSASIAQNVANWSLWGDTIFLSFAL